MVFIYSKDLRRIFSSLLKSARDLFEFMLAIVFILFLFALMGKMVIGGDIGEEHYHYDEYLNNFNDLDKSMASLYILLTTDNYPDVLLPAITVSYFYLFYFIPYMMFAIFVFAPIPTAILFNGYKQ